MNTLLKLQISGVRQKYWHAALYMRLANEAPADRREYALNEAKEMHESYRDSVRFARAIAKNYSTSEAEEMETELLLLKPLRQFN